MTLWKKAASARSSGGLELTYDSYNVDVSQSVTIPSNTATGDLILCLIGYTYEYNYPPQETPTGFTTIGKAYGSFAQGEQVGFPTACASYRIAQSGDASSSISGVTSGRATALILVKSSEPISTVTLQDFTTQFSSTVINAGSSSKACVTAAALQGRYSSPYFSSTYSDVNIAYGNFDGTVAAFNEGSGADNTYAIVSGNSADGRLAFYLEVEP